MITNDSTAIFPAIHSGGGIAPSPGRARYPPRNSTEAIAENTTIAPYSDSRKNANFRPVYSV